MHSRPVLSLQQWLLNVFIRQVGIQLQEDKNKKETYVRRRECGQNSHKMVIIIKKCLFYVMIQ